MTAYRQFIRDQWHWLELVILSLGTSLIFWIIRLIWHALNGSPPLQPWEALGVGAILGLVFTLIKQITGFKRDLNRFDALVNSGHEVVFNSSLSLELQSLLRKLGNFFETHGRTPKGLATQSAVRRILDGLSLDGRITLPIDNVDDYIDLLFELAPANGRVFATCFTDMDRFWCSPLAGEPFLELNYRLAHEKSVQIDRIIGIASADWQHREIKKREIIKLLTRTGMKPHVLITAARGHEDVFLVYDQENEPVFGIEWDVSEDGVPSKLILYFEPAQIGSSRVAFDQLTPHPIPQQMAKLGSEVLALPRAKRFLRALSDESLNQNSTQYLRLPHLRGAVRDPHVYWEGLAGTIVRPSSVTIQRLSELVESDGRAGNCAIFGCTPEVMLAFLQGGATSVTCFDLSAEMFEQMRAVARAMVSANGDMASVDLLDSRCHFSEMNWLEIRNAKKHSSAFDLVAGIDVTNMLPHGRCSSLLDALAFLLKPSGAAFLQFVAVNHRDDVVLQKFLDVVNQAQSRSAEYMYHHADQAGVNNPHDVFFYAALAYSGLADDILTDSITCDLPDTFDRFAEYKPENRDADGFSKCVYAIRETYEYCNSRLALISPDQLLMMAEAAGLVNGVAVSGTATAFDGERNFTHHMYTVQFSLRSES